MPTRSFIVATAGHVDHGKSALVRALTGTDPDRLPEEKARGITIDLGFAHLDFPGPTPDDRCHLGVVDVPGHEDFVKNMVAGVGSIDLAVLVVAADDGWMPQTEEHLQILSYLGVGRGVVALTKIDLAADEAGLRTQVRERLRGTPFADAPMVGTSVVTGRGIGELKQALTDVLKDLPPPRDVGKPRLPVDRVFTLKGIGTVVTGTLTGGPLKRGQAAVVQPSGKPTRVRNLQTHNSDVEAVGPGNRVALNLPDLAAGGGAPAHGESAVSRGDVVTLPDLGRPSDTIDVLLEKSPRAASDPAGAGRPLADGTRVYLHLGSGAFPGRVYLHDGNDLSPGGRAVAQFRSEAPVYAFAGDRFILRDWPQRHTLAGGVVLDPDAARTGFSRDARRQFLGPRAESAGDVLPFVRTELARAGAARRATLLAQSRFAAVEVAAGVAKLVSDGAAVIAADIVADGAWWRRLRDAAAAAVDAGHAARPEQLGLRLADLRGVIEKESGAAAAAAAAVADALVADLCAGGEFVRAGDRIRRATHRPALPPRLQAAGAKIRSALAAKPWDPPSRKDLTPDAAAQQALRFLLETGEAVELGPEVVLSSDAYSKAVDAITQSIREDGPATVSELKQVMGATRRVMVPLLEKLDRDGITARRGDERVLREGPG